MNKMDLYINGKPVKPAKLPRKRKKAAIKAQGRDWYKGTIKLHKIMLMKGTCTEPVCKFWVNDSIRPRAFIINGEPRMIPMATRFW